MNEASKTIAFLAAAVVAILLAVVTRPTTGEYDPSEQLGTSLAPAFEPELAKRLKIVKYDEETATSEAFEVAEKNGLWTLPSKGGYPADAQQQLAKAVTGVEDLEILQIASQDSSDHAKFGVIDPNSPKLDPGQTGVGTRVSLTEEDGEALVDIIIGEAVKDQDAQRYVRRNDQDVVFVVEIDPANFSTDFSEWIEADLLNVNAWDIAKVRIRDYTAEMFMTLQGLGVETNYRSDMVLAYQDDESKWNLESLQEPADPRKGDFQAVEIPADKTLNEETLNGLKEALDDLRIVDVSSKPEGLSANLKAGEDLVKDQQSLLSLIRRGFAPTRSASGDFDLLSSEGEVICTMRDGVEYVLRFGNLQLDTGSEAEADPTTESPDAEQGESDESKEGVNRYLFVMARLNEDAIPRPELEEVPELPEGAADEQTEEQTSEATGDEPDEASDADTGEESETETTENDAPQEEAADQSESADEESADSDPAADDPADDNTAADDEADEPSELEKAVAARKEVEQRNAQKLDQYNATLKASRERVKTLNARFGDWYYVISNDVYKKIHLSRDDVLKTKDAEEGAEGPPSTEAKPDNESAFGAPGAAVPGLPGLGAAAEDSPASESASDNDASDETAGVGEGMDNGAAGDESAGPATEETDEAGGAPESDAAEGAEATAE